MALQPAAGAPGHILVWDMAQPAAIDEVVRRVVQASLYRFQHAPQLSALVQARWRRFAKKYAFFVFSCSFIILFGF